MKINIGINKAFALLFLVIFCFGYIGIIFEYGFPVYSIFVILSLFLVLFWKKETYFSIHYIPFFLFFIYFSFHFFLSGLNYSITIGEFINGITTVVILLILPKAFNEREDFLSFLSKFRKLIIFFAVLFSSIGLYKFLLFAVTRERIGFFSHLSPLNTELIDDYNFFAAGLLIGLFVLGGKIANLRGKKPLYFFAFIIISLAVVFSGSRRGAAVLLLYMIIIFNIWFFPFIKDIFSYKVNKKNIAIIIISLCMILLGMFVFTKTGILEIGEIRFFSNKIFTRLQTILAFKEDFVQSPRGIIFKHTVEIIKSGDFFQIAFGQGFGYIPELGKLFGASEQYPHSQILSQMVFGGIVGILMLLLIYVHSTIIFITYYKDYKDILWSYVLLIFFCQFSGNTFLSFKTTLVFYIIILNLPKFEIKKGSL